MPVASSTPDTRSRLLDSAESLFAEHGIAVTSLRQITSAAGANLAAVNYHFGSKNELVAEVFARRVDPLNQDRLRRLELAVELSAPGPPNVNDVVLAFVAPALELRGSERGRALVRLLGRMHSEPSYETRQAVFGRFAQVFDRFRAVLARALPDLPAAELLARMKHFVGVLAFLMMDPLPVPRAEAAARDELAWLVTFVSAGLRAPATPKPGARS